jgi:hypothetical protein
MGKTPDTKREARLDGVGIWWITLAAVWTILLLSGMVFLYRKRNTPTLRLRGLPLTFTGMVLQVSFPGGCPRSLAYLSAWV